MDAERFDNLLRSLAASRSRRGIGRAVAGFALLGPFSALLGFNDTEAKKRKRRKKKKKCKGDTKKCGKKCISASDCCRAADCGAGGICTGGGCLCSVGFTTCEGRCIPDTACCTADDCGVCETCQEGQCVGCPTGQECVDGQCRCTTSSCPGCCEDDTCQSGQSNGACGSGGEQCVVCANGSNCQDGTCVCTLECCGNDVCPPGDICAQNQCVTGQGTCPTGADFCQAIEGVCGLGNQCQCTTTMAGQTRCAQPGTGSDCGICTNDATCAALFPGIPGVFCVLGGATCCTGFCMSPCES